MDPFAAIDLETSHTDRDSVCAMGVACFAGEELIGQRKWLIRPPSRDQWMFAALHGIEREHVADAPWWAIAWHEACEMIRGAKYLVAYNVPFERSAVAASCKRSRIVTPGWPWRDALTVARQRLPHLANHQLPTVAAALSVPLEHHHDALEDAVAAGRVWNALHARAVLR